MYRTPRRLNVKAWFALAAAGPTALGAVAAAATGAGLARDAGLWAAVLLAPPLALALRSLERRPDEPEPRPWSPEHALRAALALSTAAATAILLAVLAGAPLDGPAIACGLAAAATPLALAIPAALTAWAVPGLLKTAGVTEPLDHPDSRRWQRTVQRAEDERLEEMARQAEARRQITRLEPGLGREQEAGQRQHPVLVRLARAAADGPAGPGTDVDQVVDRAGGRAAREVQPEPQVGQQPRLEPHEHRRPDLGVGERLAQRLEGQEGAGMRLALGQGARHDGRRGGDAGQGPGIVEQRRRPRARRLEAGRAELLGDAGAVARQHPGAGLEQRADAPGTAAGDMGGPAAVPGRQQIDDGAVLAVRTGGQHEGVVGEFHPIKLWAPAEEIQPPGARRSIRLWVPDDAVDPLDPEADTAIAPPVTALMTALATARMDEALAELRTLLHRYRGDVVSPIQAPPPPHAAAA